MDLFEHAARRGAENEDTTSAPTPRRSSFRFTLPAHIVAALPPSPPPTQRPPAPKPAPVSAPATTVPPPRAFARRPAMMATGEVAEDEPMTEAACVPEAPAGTSELRGKVRRERFRAADSGYTVLVVKFDDEPRESTLQVTTTTRVHEGDRIVAIGRWGMYKGQSQFKAEMLQLEIPREAKGIAEWLKNGGVPGVGKATIKQLVARFGDHLPDVIGDAAELATCIKVTAAQAIAKAWNNNADQPELVALLGGSGLKPRQIARVIETYGASIRRVIDTNPWELVEEIEGIGFLTADRMAQARGLDMTCPPRIQAGLGWVLNESLVSEGHCGVPPADLRAKAARMLEVSHSVIEGGLPSFIDGVRVIHDEDSGLIYPRSLWDAECDLAEHLAALVTRSTATLDAPAAGMAVLAAERELGVSLDRDGGQFEAAVMSLINPVTIITGGPGTGKSTTQRVIAKAMELAGRKVLALAAPTGRAAKRLSETSGREARTIHRLLEFSASIGDFAHNEDNPLKIDGLILDEVSMVDVRLFAALLKALPPDCCLLLVGDYDQLPSVGPGQVLRDLIASDLLPVARLTRVHRQAEGSGIAAAAHRINHGLPPIEPGVPMSGFQVFDYSDAAVIEEVVNLVRFTLPEMGFDPMRDVQVLVPQRKGEYGMEALNAALKAALNPAIEGDPNTARLMDRLFTVGDRIMQVRNDYQKGVYNGEVGVITAVGETPDDNGRRATHIIVDYSGVEARYTATDVDDIDLAFATTVHKSQGCEFPVVIFVAPRDHRRMLNRNLFYTGVTRARLECMVIGDAEVIDNAVRIADSFRRHTGLQGKLAAAMESRIAA